MDATSDALKTRKNRIKNKMDAQIFERVFGVDNQWDVIRTFCLFYFLMNVCYHCYHIIIVSFASSVYFWSEILNPFIMKAKFYLFIVGCFTSSEYVFLCRWNDICAKSDWKIKLRYNIGLFLLLLKLLLKTHYCLLIFFSTVPVVTVIIKDAETEEVVYTSTDLNVNKVYVDLAGEEKVNISWNTAFGGGLYRRFWIRINLWNIYYLQLT